MSELKRMGANGEPFINKPKVQVVEDTPKPVKPKTPKVVVVKPEDRENEEL